MKRQIIQMNNLPTFIIIIIIIPFRSCFLLSEQYLDEPNLKVLRYGDPCFVIRDPELDMEIQFNREFKNKGQRPCLTEKLYMYDFCQLKFKMIENIIDRLPSVQKKREKRAMITSAFDNAIIIVKRITAAATSFLYGIAKNTVENGINTFVDTLIHDLLEQMSSNYINKTLIPFEIESDELTRLSIFAKDLPLYIRESIETNSYLRRYIEYINHKLSVTYALFLSIEDNLKVGLIDTHSIGELTNDINLMKIEPKMTRLIQISVDLNHRTIRFEFEILFERNLFERIIWGDMLLIISIFISFSFIIYLISILGGP